MSWLIAGLGWTLGTALIAWVIALGIGSILGVIRTTPVKWAVRLGDAYVELFRNIPLLVQMFLWFFVLPELVPTAIGDTIKQMPPPWAAFVPAVFRVLHRARVAEQVRAGISAAARGNGRPALGLSVPRIPLRPAAEARSSCRR
jgi:glutamate/aspartate transport system permease protein